MDVYLATSKEVNRVADALPVGFQRFAGLHLHVGERAEVVHECEFACGGVNLAEECDHLEALVLELGVVVEALGGVPGEGSKEYRAKSATGFLVGGGGEKIFALGGECW